MEDADAVAVSAVTIWEIEIKRALNRMRAPDRLAELADESGFEPLLIDFEHAREAGRLPLHHGDPFDRMLIAQARVEGLTLATADEAMAPYGVAVLPIARA
jgi:PIN domain nuclease of toxin-antitoxin system